jgi:hypothetical protein
MSTESEPITDDESSTGQPQDTDDEIRREGDSRTSGAQMEAVDVGTDDDVSLREPLLSESSVAGYRDRWEQIQARFVDDPRSSVEQADALVNEVIHDLETSFGSERDTLEGQWQRGEDVHTEDLRIVLRRYRSFFGRLLAA